MLADAIESVYAQTFTDWELIVVDDGSTDETPQLMQRWKDDPRVRYIQQMNAGVAAARNCGIEAANGKYIAFLDSDDQWMAEKLERQIPCFNSDPAPVLVYSAYRARYADGTVRIIPANLQGQVYRSLLKILPDGFFFTSTIIIPRAVFAQTGLFAEDIHFGEDLDLWLRVAHLGEVARVETPLVVKYEGVAYSYSPYVEMFRRLLERAAKRDPELSPQQKRRILSRIYATAAHQHLFNRDGNLPRALWYYLRAFTLWPFQIRAVKRFVRAAGYRIYRKLGGKPRQ
jgi:glycosyltransferase involved in cell wall biosynthesis